jgi:HNH endonuclease
MLIKLTNKSFAVIDDKDESLVIGCNWFSVKNKNVFYARSGKKLLHRVILGAKAGQIVDHINGDGLDNRRSNLRITTHQGNKANSHHGKYTSKFIGVSKVEDVKRKKPFRVMAKKDGKKIHLGYFEYEIDAAKAYDIYAIEIYGDLAVTNFSTPPF